MKRTALVALVALVFAAPATHAFAQGNFFMLAGQVGKVACYPVPALERGKQLLQCEVAVLPAPAFEPRISVYCLDPKVALACNSLAEGDPVLIVSEELSRRKTVTHVGYWLDGAF